MNARIGHRLSPARGLAAVAALASAMALAACTTGPSGEITSVDVAQGSDQNISSLTEVIQRNPTDPEAYNVRGRPMDAADAIARRCATSTKRSNCSRASIRLTPIVR